VRVLVDEDVASHALLDALSAVPGLELLPPARASSDEEVWDRAQREAAAILTGNARDFVPYARRFAAHAGLLLVIRKNRPDDLTTSEIAPCVGKIAEAYPDGIAGMTLVVNAFASDE
jgi:predicted nuclease of predicted toxin-antitoxin system